MKIKRNWVLITVLVALTLLFLYPLKNFIFSVIEVGIITGNVVDNQDILQNLLVPSAITSIIFSIIGLITMSFLIIQIRSKSVHKVFPFKGYLTAISIVFVVFLINYFITFFPYGNFVLQAISFILQIIIYGILIPYILTAQISYIVLLLKGDIKGILN